MSRTFDKALDKRKPTYPADHVPGMPVPKGGSSCANCRFLQPGNNCAEPNFQRWNGGPKIPAPADSYCSDWYMPTATPPVGVPAAPADPSGG
jgi:hypothetical protein